MTTKINTNNKVENLSVSIEHCVWTSVIEAAKGDGPKWKWKNKHTNTRKAYLVMWCGERERKMLMLKSANIASK